MRVFILPAALSVALGFGSSAARADVVRFHYQPTPCNGHTTLKVAPDGATGEWRPWALGLRHSNFYCQPRATHMVTYLHPYTGRHITLPIAFPAAAGTPRIAYERDAVLYSYTGYAIRVEFRPDGSADVVYNSGLFRPF